MVVNDFYKRKMPKKADFNQKYSKFGLIEPKLDISPQKIFLDL